VTVHEAMTRMKFGCAWYPEQWDESRWPEDLGLMREAGMNVVRMGEFAWSRLEPEEARFDLDWLERAVALAARHGLETVLGTPTAAPPSWLTHRYPDTLLVRDDGRRASHGNRCHFSPASARYRDFCRKVTEEMARRFGRNTAVIAWQIDNEYNAVSYDEDTRRKFQEFLRHRYRTLDELNARWTTAYWSQTYGDWAEIPFPIGSHNPALMLDFRRFITQVYVDYQNVQIDAIRRHSDRPITHNFMGWFDLFDHYAVTGALDFASWDSYAGSGHLDFMKNGSGHDLVRGFLRKNFWVMETQPGSVNWSGINKALDRGEVRTMAWHAVGHGADAILYWQWRSALNGQEQYHGSLVAPDGKPRPVYREITEIGRDLARCTDHLSGTSIAPDCALLHSYEDRWALDFQRHHQAFDPVAHFGSYYRALRAEVPAVDVVHPSAAFSGYRLIIAPHLHIVGNDTAERLDAFVRGGGHLVIGPRSGMKNRDSALLPSRQPGPLARTLGAHVEEYYALDAPVRLQPAGEAHIWAEWLVPDEEDTEIVLRYGASNGWLDDKPAVVSRRHGSGRITYVGAWLCEATMKRLTRGWIAESGVKSVAVPDAVELCRRTGPHGDVWICINHGATPTSVDLPAPARDLISGQTCSTQVSLAGYGVAVLVAT
jgi:beta-galactosidase